MKRYLFVLIFILPLFADVDSFIGYHEWKDARPYIEVKIDNDSQLPIDTKVHLSCKNADKFKISNFPDFKGARWRPMTSSLKWVLDEEASIATIFVIFKKSSKGDGPSFISKIVSYSFDRNNLLNKIERFSDSGYIDWTSGTVHVTVSSEYKGKAGERYNYDKAQQDAEKKLYKHSYNILKNISVNYFYKVNDILKLNRSLYEKMNLYLKNISITDIKNLSRESVMIVGKLPFFVTDQELGSIAFLSQPLKERIDDEINNLYDTVFEQLVLDVRGFKFTPCLFPKVVTQHDQPVVDVSRFTNDNAIFVRYIRSLDSEGGYKDKGSSIKNQLYVKALGLSSEDRSKIYVTYRNKRLIMANKSTIEKICNGNFVILIE